MVKLNDDLLAWTTADRAMRAAQAGDDPLTLAEARRAVATVLRRTGRPAQARDLLLSAAGAIEPGHRPSPDQLSMYGTLSKSPPTPPPSTATMVPPRNTSARATVAADRLGSDANHRFTAFGPSDVILYQVSVAQVLGDSGTAIEYARKLRPATITTAERQGRYWIDVARAYHQWGKPEPCYRALLSAERAAPAEVELPATRPPHDQRPAPSRPAPVPSRPAWPSPTASASQTRGGTRDVRIRYPGCLGPGGDSGGLLTLSPALQIHVSEAGRGLPPLASRLSM